MPSLASLASAARSRPTVLHRGSSARNARAPFASRHAACVANEISSRSGFGVPAFGNPNGGSRGPRCVALSREGARSPSSRVSGTSRRVTPAAPSSRRGASCVVAAGKGSDVAADAESTPSPIASVAAFAKANYFLLGMFACVFVAAAYPSIGANGGPLKPEVTINKLAVRLMFLISGLSLPLDDLRSAVTNVGANVRLRNEGGGRFHDVTQDAGVGDTGWGTSTAFLDYDADGDLDLFVAAMKDVLGEGA